MLTLLLILMFPTFLAVVAIYLILLRIGDDFPALGLDTRTSVWSSSSSAGALGINTWLMKGFFDSIPDELDESARVDGATPAQVFWGIILPLGAPVLAVVGLLSFIATMNEFIIASRLLQTTTSRRCPSACTASSATSTRSTGGRSAQASSSRRSLSWSCSSSCSGSSSTGLTAGSVKG